MNPTMFGIPNCNSIKKARDWLSAHHIDYTFHNYKKDGITAQVLATWAEQVGWEVLLNKRGTTWRKLPPSNKEHIDQTKALQLLADNPAMIKRPVLIAKQQILVGFDADCYAEAFK